MRVFGPGLVALAAIASCDDTGAVDGARGPCAVGPDSLPCTRAVTSPESACTRLVACAAIPLDAEDDFDWGRCVDELDALTDDRARLVIACIGASRCDELRVAGSPDDPYGAIYCLELGDR